MPFSPCDPTQPTCSDVTVGILQHIFGPIIDVLTRGADPNTVQAASNVLASIFGLYNTGVLAVASLIISYVATVGAVNTANDGEAMGKQWSSVWTPLRIVTGGAILLPSTSGYSFIQMFVLTLSLWGIGFANGIYKMGMSFGVFKADGIVASSYQPGTYYGMRDFAKQYLAAAYCARAANSIYTDPAGSPSVMADSANPDRKVVTGTRTDYTFYIKDRNPVTDLAGGEPICGTVTMTSYTVSNNYTDTTGTQAALDNLRATLVSQKVAGAMALMKDIDSWVATMPSDINQTGWDQVQSSQLNALVKVREDQVSGQIATAMSGVGDSTGANAVKAGTSAFIDSLTQQGWAMAAGWYQQVGLLRSKLSTISTESVGQVTQPSLSALPSDARARLLSSSVSTVSETVVKKAEQNGNGYDASTTPRPEDLASMLPKSGSSDFNVGALSGDMSRKLTLAVNGLMQSGTNVVIGSSPDVDAISRMKLTGDLLASYRVIFLTAKFTINTTMTAARVVVSGVGGVEILGNKIDESGPLTSLWDWLQAEVIPVLTDLAQSLGYLAFYFSVVLPSVPYTIFMITVVGWLLGVLQTVIAAPLWATMHMRPSQTFVGSDAQGYLLLLALFIRPALAIIGLFAAMLLADPIVDYITKAFFAMRGDVVASTGWVGAISQFSTFYWWFLVFGGVLLPVLYMVYGLPQVLPDHVLRWINAGVHDLGATNATSAMQSRQAPQAAAANADYAKRIAGGGGGGGGGAGPGGGNALPGLLTSDSEGRMGGGKPINSGEQGVGPSVSDGGSSGGGGGGSASRSSGGAGGGGSSAVSAGQQGTAPSSEPKRGLADKLSDAAGVAIGRGMTDTAMAVKDAAAGGREGFAGRLGGNLKDAAVSAGSEGAAAFSEGADSRVGAFKTQMAMRTALSETPEAASSSPATKSAAASTSAVNGGGGSSSPAPEASSPAPGPAPAPQAAAPSSARPLSGGSGGSTPPEPLPPSLGM